MAGRDRLIAAMTPARFSSIMPRPERPPSWVDEQIAPPEEGGVEGEGDSWAYNLPRIRGSVDPQSPHWPQSPLFPAAPPDMGSRTPSYNPFELWERGGGVYPWTHQNAPWRRPQGL